MHAHINLGKRPSKEVISPRKELKDGQAEEATRFTGQAECISPKKVTVIDLDKSYRKLLGKDIITFALNAL